MIVPPETHPGVKIALVGEAPGETEEKLGKPFVGRAGELLDFCLHNSGITRRDCHITNVIKERPPANDIRPFLDLNRKPPYESDRYKQYKEMLKNELIELKPNVCVAVGATALWALCGKLGITKWRGSILESSLIPGLKVVPTIHPAAALRQYMFRYSIIFDLKRVKEEAVYSELRQPERIYLVKPSLEDTMSFLELTKSWQQVYPDKPIAFDIEVWNRQVSCISFAYTPSSAISIPFIAENNNPYWPSHVEAEVWRAISNVLEEPAITKVAQNGIFDSTFLATQNKLRVQGLKFDTMVGFHLLYPDLPKGLDFICSTCTREPYYKDEGKFWKTGGSWRDNWIYNAKDSAVCLEAWSTISKELKEKQLWPTFEFVMQLLEPLIFMSVRGIKVNQEALKAYSKQLKIEYDTLQIALNAAAGQILNPHSSKQLQAYFYVAKGEPPYVSRTTGAMTADDEAMARLERKGYQEATIIRKMREIRKMTGTYLDIEFDQDQRMRCSYNPAGTTTGRLSSSKTILGTGTNMQNIPKEARSFMIPDEDCVLCEVDLSQAEARVVAYLAGDPNMMRVFENGEDIHLLTANLIGTDRRTAKTVNHASNYDMGPGKLSLLLGVAQRDAAQLLNSYHMVYPGIRSVFHQSIQRQLRVNRTLTNLLGRRRIFLERWDDELFRQAYAFIPQSTVVDVINKALVEIYQRNLVDPLAQVHDSIVFQVLLDQPERLAALLLRLKQIIEIPLTYAGRSFVIPAEFKLGPNWRDLEVVDVTEAYRLAECLRGVYRKLGTTKAISYLDSAISNGRSTATQGLA